MDAPNPKIDLLRAAMRAGDWRKAIGILCTAQGQPFKAAGFGNWFREACDTANVRGCSAHGLRKASCSCPKRVIPITARTATGNVVRSNRRRS